MLTISILPWLKHQLIPINLAKEALSSEKKLKEVLALLFDSVVQVELGVIIEQIRSLNKSIAELEKNDCRRRLETGGSQKSDQY